MTGWRRLLVVLAAVLGAVVFVSTAAADRPVKTEFSDVTVSSVLSGVCSFDVNVDSVVSGTEIDYGTCKRGRVAGAAVLARSRVPWRVSRTTRAST